MTITIFDLPRELVEYFIDFLWSDKASLSALGLAHSYFLDATQRHLFAKLSISGPKANRLYQLSKTRSFTFIPAICDLSLCCESRADTLTEEARLLDFIRLLHPKQIKALLLFGYCTWHGQPSIVLNPDTLAKFGDVTKLTLEAIHFGAFAVFTSLVASFPHLRVLSLKNLAWEPPRPGLHEPTVQELEELSLQWCYVRDVLCWMLDHTTHYLKVKSLNLGMVRQSDTPAIGRFLSSISHTIKHLRFGFDGLCSGGDAEAFNEHVDLSKLNALRSLFIDNLITEAYTLEDAYPHVLTLLSSTSSVLAQFSFTADLRCRLHGVGPSYEQIMDWDTFNSILNSRSFSGLERLVVVVLYRASPMIAEDFEAFLRNRLTSLHHKQILECQGLSA